MRLCKFSEGSSSSPRLGFLEAEAVLPIEAADATLTALFQAASPESLVAAWAGSTSAAIALDRVRLHAPIDSEQEVWGAGVTYERSKVAREEESESAATFYDLVYRAERPELFFKANPRRVVGPGESIRVRRDTKWCVPEPELTLAVSSRLEIIGYTVGNDVSARDIEGENPLYLPQAKVYDACCALGPCITLVSGMPPIREVGIRLEITRGGSVVVDGSTSIARMARSLEDLVSWLGRDNGFPAGVFLVTGTGIVPPDEFSLEPGDRVAITIDGIGRLENGVVRG
ncbi:MAG: fumarylacetoacetate hydrolase family protein [Isosphaeraceae bacterium]|nr:fumarylacetoacetate hydrolase family protein [Isosphaeraceae bacterium]